ncbi:hypothetical protein KUCAC02_010105 [Chaenocephalus aceratus]|uniref:Uncharacterized protein n=1 Tax=Chaenocephalus aceratus TaxID=36190 RepID=A0ACB9VY84_CHAAC|nr:hypothetical protein KUCAC02_010105 [Chaenocephalus aceratus]
MEMSPNNRLLCLVPMVTLAAVLPDPPVTRTTSSAPSSEAPPQYLVLLGLRTLRIHSAVPEAPYPHQEMTISPAAGLAMEIETLSFDISSSLRVTFLDVAVLNGLSALKAYSVLGPPAHTLPQHFPHLALPPDTPGDPTDPSEQASEPPLLFTFVY